MSNRSNNLLFFTIWFGSRYIILLRINLKILNTFPEVLMTLFDNNFLNINHTLYLVSIESPR